MSAVTGSASACLADVQSPIRISGLVAGAALHAVSPCYIGVDGLVYESLATHASTPTGTSASAFDGFTAVAYASGEGGVTLFGQGSRMRLADSGLVIGSLLFAGSAAGVLSTVPLYAEDNQFPVAKAISASDLMVMGAH